MSDQTQRENRVDRYRFANTCRGSFKRVWIALALVASPSSLQSQTVSNSEQDSQVATALSRSESTPNRDDLKDESWDAKEPNSKLSNKFFYANPGPWGKLRCMYMYLEPSTDMVDALPLPHGKIRWTFQKSDIERLSGIFEKAGLPVDMRQRLVNPANQSLVDNELIIFPALQDVEAMTPAMREAIYPLLATSSTDQFYTFPILMTTKTVKEWFCGSKLRPDLVEKIRSMSYKRGDAIGFSDVAALLNYAQSERDARNIFKSLLRTQSLMIQLELPEGQDTKPLVDYWTSGALRWRNDIEPIIESAFGTQGLNQLELSHLLPPIPRKLLYTYPGFNYTFNGTLPDCHWTTLNFFNQEPHEYLLDTRFVDTFLQERCVPAQPPNKFGDLLFMIEPKTGGLLHSCVYLADDFVFTKNGRNAISPWVVMKFKDVAALYSRDSNLLLQVFRLQEPK